MEIQVSKEIHRPVADVWRFYAVEHVRNHPRWTEPSLSGDAIPGLHIAWSVGLLPMGMALIA